MNWNERRPSVWLRDRWIETKIRSHHQIEGFLAPVEALALYRLASQLGTNSTIVEIGCWKGKSTYCLAKGLRSGTVITIDPFDSSGDEASARIYESSAGSVPLLAQFEARMRALGVLGKIRILQGMSSAFVTQIPRIDLLFIDGDHSIDGCGFDFTSYAPAIVPNGIIAFHDYDAARPDSGPTWVVNHRLNATSSFSHVGLFGSLWIARRKASLSK